MNIKTSKALAGSFLGNVFTQQDALRQLGNCCFELHSSNSIVFSDVQYLPCTSEDLRLAMFRDKESLITKLTNSYDLSDCVIPHRGAQSAGLIKEGSIEFEELIKTKSRVASSYSVLGLSVRKFGSESVINEF